MKKIVSQFVDKEMLEIAQDLDNRKGAKHNLKNLVMGINFFAILSQGIHLLRRDLKKSNSIIKEVTFLNERFSRKKSMTIREQQFANAIKEILDIQKEIPDIQKKIIKNLNKGRFTTLRNPVFKNFLFSIISIRGIENFFHITDTIRKEYAEYTEAIYNNRQYQQQVELPKGNLPNLQKTSDLIEESTKSMVKKKSIFSKPAIPIAITKE